MSNENKPNWNDLQNEQAYTNAWQIDKIWTTARKLPMYFWVMSALLITLIGVTLQQNKIIKNMTKATHEKTESNRQQSKKFFQMRKQNEDALRDQIDKLNSEVETEQKQKRILRVELKKSQNLCIEHSKTIANAKSHDLADKMLNEAYQTIAMNAVPFNLQQYIEVASDEQWIGYAEMAAQRNSHNVIKTIASIPALMKIDEVASVVNDYSRVIELADTK